jgi:hypothetical protein
MSTDYILVEMSRCRGRKPTVCVCLKPCVRERLSYYVRKIQDHDVILNLTKSSYAHGCSLGLLRCSLVNGTRSGLEIEWIKHAKFWNNEQNGMQGTNTGYLLQVMVVDPSVEM